MFSKQSLPGDVQQYVRNLFGAANGAVTQKLSRSPTVTDAALETTLIEHLRYTGAPVLLNSKFVVKVESVYFAPKKEMYDRVADIALLFIFRGANRVQLSKFVLLRLAKLEYVGYENNSINNYRYLGAGGLRTGPVLSPDVLTADAVDFNAQCQYGGLNGADIETDTRDKFYDRTSIPTFFLLCNPITVPLRVGYPTAVGDGAGEANFAPGACRVISSKTLKKIVASETNGAALTYAQIFDGNLKKSDQLRLEDFAVDEILNGRSGYLSRDLNDKNLHEIYNASPIQVFRTGAIITIDSPEDLAFSGV